MKKDSSNKWIITITVITASLLQLIDTSIVNVTLTQMMGNLGATLGDISWVVTGYAAANVVMITLSGWLSAKFGRKTYFTASVVLFTVASVFCGTSTTISELIIFRIIQGIGGGGLLSTAQAILIDTFPREELATANAIFGMGVIIGPSIGPTLGGYLTDHLSWHWVFFINIPIGIIAAMLSMLYIRESPHKTTTGKLDTFALALLIITIGGMQVILEKGETEDWFDSPYITILIFAATISGILFIWRQLNAKQPILNIRLLKNRQFAIGIFFSFIQGIGVYASVFIIPVFCQSILGYTSQQTGWLLMPGSLAAGAMMPIVAMLMKRTKISPIALAGCGFFIFVIFVWKLSSMSLNTGADEFFWPLILRGVGLGLLFIPLLTISIFPLHNKDIPQGTAMSNMIRQLGGSFGIAMATTYISTRSMFHVNRLSDHISLNNQTTWERFNTYKAFFMSKGADLNLASQRAIAVIKASVMKQSLLLTYNDVFLIVGIFFLACIPLLLLFRVDPKKMGRMEEKAEIHMVD